MEKEILMSYLRNKIGYYLQSDKNVLDEIFKKDSQIKQYESPDIVVLNNNKVIGIEHFSFDSSATRKNSSLSKKELAKSIRQFNKMRNTTLSGHPKYFQDNIRVKSDYQNYLKNFERVFNKHYKNIINYKSRLEKEYPNIENEISFFIEDTTILGSKVETAEGTAIIDLLILEEFKNILKKHENISEKVPYIFFASKFLGKIHFVSTKAIINNHKVYNEIKLHNKIDFDEIRENIELLHFVDRIE